MSYFLDLVKTLNDNEQKHLRLMDVGGKFDLVRNQYAQHAYWPGFNETQLPAKLKLTKSHFDKIVSVLLDKTLKKLAGDELSKRLEFLISKQLYTLALHELKVTEKKMKAVGDKSALKAFYLSAFRATVLFNFNNYPEEQIIYYCQCYLKLLNKAEQEEAYKVMAKREEMIIRYHQFQKNGARRIAQARQLLLKLEKEIDPKKMPEAALRIYLGISAYYDISDIEKSMQYLLKASNIAKQVYDKITDREKAFLLGMVANQLIDLNRIEEGIEKYDEAFSKFPELMSGRLFHAFNYAFALLIAGDFKKAGILIENFIQPFLKNEYARNYRFDILRLHAIVHLLKNETEEAGNYLQQIMQFGKEDFTPLGDLLFRFVHNVYCLQTKDYNLAGDVLKKNLKFVKSKIDIADFDTYHKMFLTLGEAIRLKSRSKKLPDNFAAKHTWDKHGKSRLYFQLIVAAFNS